MSNPTVHLSPSCSLVGKVTRLPGASGTKDIFAFLGVPYAEPPINGLRFRDPQPIKLWEGKRDAVKYGLLLCTAYKLIKLLE